ncbi:MAG: GldG family protein [Elusimicrobia bacterium]|nr:GldG family protein [Elusimicrobiota bacterium]
MEERQRRRALVFSWAGAAALLAALAAGNALSSLLFARADLSADRAYSISRGTKDLLRGLQDTLTIKAYYTPGLPPPYGPGRRYLKDLLAEYQSAGRGRVRVELISPDTAKRRREAVDAGVAPLQLSVTSRERFEIKESFMGAVFLYRGRSEAIPVIGGTSDLEYDITRRIKKLVSGRTRTVGFVTGHGEAAPGDPVSGPLFAAVSEQMKAVPVALDQPVPADVDALWVWGPSSPLKPAELDRLKAWLASGRSLGLLLSRRTVDLRSFRARPVETGLEPLLAGWGLELPDGFVVDAQCEKIQMEMPYGPLRSIMVVDYPFIPIATQMDRRHPAVRGLDAVAFPFAAPIRVKPGTRNYTSLVDSSKASWLSPSPSADPRTSVEDLVTKDQGPFSLAGVLETGPGRLIIVGTAQQARPQFAGKEASAAFLMNLLEWSLQDEALLSIRSKGAAYRPLRPLSLAAMLAAKYSLIFFLPLVLVAAGLTRYAQRKARRRELAERFDDA